MHRQSVPQITSIYKIVRASAIYWSAEYGFKFCLCQEIQHYQEEDGIKLRFWIHSTIRIKTNNHNPTCHIVSFLFNFFLFTIFPRNFCFIFLCKFIQNWYSNKNVFFPMSNSKVLYSEKFCIINNVCWE